ncbi:MAG: acetolactate synthase [Micromonosporaceae bacterium]
MTEPSNGLIEGHGGYLALAALRGHGVDEIFTLSGGHIFPLYDAAHRTGVRLVDVRHEQTAVFAAEAVAKLQRRPGVAALTAGPGVTNGVSALTSAHFNGSPVMVLGGRAPQWRWGAGSLQELDHVPIVASITKHAATVTSTGAIPAEVRHAAQVALTAHRGPVFLDFPMDVIFSRAEAQIGAPTLPQAVAPDPEQLAEAAGLIGRAKRPVIIAGSDVHIGDAVVALQECARELQIPVYANGMGRGCLPLGDPLAFSRSRREALKAADVVIVAGTPLDFRLGFGDFGEAAVVHLVDAPSQQAPHVTAAASVAGDLSITLRGIAAQSGAPASRAEWISRLRRAEDRAREADRELLEADTDPIKPTRVYGELRRALDPDAVIICDGGDFVSYAGKYLEPGSPGCWLDPGPYGCLGVGPGYAIGARLTYPDRQVCLLLGDGAAGFSLMDAESLVRQGLPVVIVVGNNGIWGLEKHPMKAVYGYDVAADLQPGLRYDDVVRALGGAGETVQKPEELGPALKRAFSAGVPYLVNVLTDPTDAYPRSANLA